MFRQRALRLYILLMFTITPKLFGLDAINITDSKINGAGLGQRSLSYAGEEGIEIVSRRDFAHNFSPGQTEKHGFDYTKPTFWVKIKFFNPYGSDHALYLSDGSNYAESIKVYRSSQLVGTLTQAQYLRQRIVEIMLPAKSYSTIYIQKKSLGSQRQTWVYWNDRDQMIHHIRDSERDWGLIMAILCMSLMFNAMFYFAYRTRLFLCVVRQRSKRRFRKALWTLPSNEWK